MSNFLIVWGIIISIFGAAILWPVAVGTVFIVLLALFVTGMMAWTVTHIEDDF